MSFLDLMKLLLELSLIQIVTANVKGQKWQVHITPLVINATSGSTVTIQCTFNYPSVQQTDNVKLYWKVPETSAFDTKEKDQRAFIYHPNDTYVLEEYRKKTKLIGDKKMKNCSLVITDIRRSLHQIYLRVAGRNDSYSFVRNSVSINLYGDTEIAAPADNLLTTIAPESSTLPMILEISTIIYIASFAAAAAVLIIIIVVGIVCYKKCKRPQSFSREESAYYLNVNRASLTQVKREEPSTNQESKQVSHFKVIDEPVYINLETPSCQMAQTTNQTDNLYGNIDYSK